MTTRLPSQRSSATVDNQRETTTLRIHAVTTDAGKASICFAIEGENIPDDDTMISNVFQRGHVSDTQATYLAAKQALETVVRCNIDVVTMRIPSRDVVEQLNETSPRIPPGVQPYRDTVTDLIDRLDHVSIQYVPTEDNEDIRQHAVTRLTRTDANCS